MPVFIRTCAHDGCGREKSGDSRAIVADEHVGALGDTLVTVGHQVRTTYLLQHNAALVAWGDAANHASLVL